MNYTSSIWIDNWGLLILGALELGSSFEGIFLILGFFFLLG